MVALVLSMAALGQFVESPDFPKAMQSRALESTVRVFQPSLRGEGSGVVVMYQAGTAYILTAHHVVPPGQNADAVEITFFPQGKPSVMLKGKVDVRMSNEDLAVIVVRMNQPPPGVAPICPADAAPGKVMQKPMPVLTVGMGPLGTPEVEVDQIREHKLINKEDGSRAFHWQAEKPQSVGRSGGPLLDTEGRVIGICSGTKGNKGYYVSIYEIRSALTRKGLGFLTR